VSEPSALTSTNLSAAANNCLLEHGYSLIAQDLLGGTEEEGRFYEDGYGIVLIAVFDTWGELAEHWPESQAALVQLISAHLSKSEAKAWDGYLVLLTPAASTGGREAVDSIRYDTSRLRKLVADGEELRSLANVEDALLPLLPLAPVLGDRPEGSVLDLLPELLARRGVEPRVAKTLIEAFSKGEPLLESLHQLEAEK
jgi:hypothetical protein